MTTVARPSKPTRYTRPNAGSSRASALSSGQSFPGAALCARPHVGHEHARATRLENNVVQVQRRIRELVRAGDETLPAGFIDRPHLVKIRGNEFFSIVNDAFRIVEAVRERRHTAVAGNSDNPAVPIILFTALSHDGYVQPATEAAHDAFGVWSHLD